jgi:hypothetical protein
MWIGLEKLIRVVRYLVNRRCRFADQERNGLWCLQEVITAGSWASCALSSSSIISRTLWLELDSRSNCNPYKWNVRAPLKQEQKGRIAEWRSDTSGSNRITQLHACLNLFEGVIFQCTKVSIFQSRDISGQLYRAHLIWSPLGWASASIEPNNEFPHKFCFNKASTPLVNPKLSGNIFLTDVAGIKR